MSILNQTPVSLRDILQRKFPKLFWTVESILPEGAITILSGQPASYKTWVLLHIAMCVASGKPVFNHFSVKQTGVLMIDEENGERLLQMRLNTLGADRDLPISFYTNKGFDLTPETAIKIIDICRKNSIGLIIIDSLVRIHNGDENKSGDMAQVFKLLRQISESGPTILITHHNRKQPSGYPGQSSEMRGSGDILASIDSHISLIRRERTLFFNQTKQRFAEELAPFQVQLVNNEPMELIYTGAENDDSAALKSVILSAISQSPNINQARLMEQLDKEGNHINEHKLRRSLKELVSSASLKETRGAGKTLLYEVVDTEPEKA